jgi:hypothetical protein
MGQDDVRCQRSQVRRVSANFGRVGATPASVGPHVAADDPAQLPESLKERPDEGLKLRIVRGRGEEYADAPHPLGLLRAGGEGPSSRRAAEEGDELAPSHECASCSITSSATSPLRVGAAP